MLNIVKQQEPWIDVCEYVAPGFLLFAKWFIIYELHL